MRDSLAEILAEKYDFLMNDRITDIGVIAIPLRAFRYSQVP
jgi:3-hydroxymyristoyl/3-hydroxydecanoyl-(acyl carrier protein) dehydratase